MRRAPITAAGPYRAGTPGLRHGRGRSKPLIYVLIRVALRPPLSGSGSFRGRSRCDSTHRRRQGARPRGSPKRTRGVASSCSDAPPAPGAEGDSRRAGRADADLRNSIRLLRGSGREKRDLSSGARRPKVVTDCFWTGLIPWQPYNSATRCPLQVSPLLGSSLAVAVRTEPLRQVWIASRSKSVPLVQRKAPNSRAWRRNSRSPNSKGR